MDPEAASDFPTVDPEDEGDEAFVGDEEGNLVDGEVVADLDDEELPDDDDDEDEDVGDASADAGSGAAAPVPGDDDSLHSFEAHTGESPASHLHSHTHTRTPHLNLNADFLRSRAGTSWPSSRLDSHCYPAC